jgi:hypothetical protein
MSLNYLIINYIIGSKTVKRVTYRFILILSNYSKF